MKLVIDTNRIVAALIKDSVSRKILLNKKFEFVCPEFAVSEIANYKIEILKKAKITESEFEVLLSLFFERITVIPITEYAGFLERAKPLIDDIDDVPFLALFLSLKVNGIWSDDRHFQKQKEVKIFTTKELVEQI